MLDYKSNHFLVINIYFGLMSVYFPSPQYPGLRLKKSLKKSKMSWSLCNQVQNLH